MKNLTIVTALLWFAMAGCGKDEPNGTPNSVNSGENNSMSGDAGDMGDGGGGPSDAGDMPVDMFINPPPFGTCATDADCPQDWQCVAVPADEPNGYHTCQFDEGVPPGCAQIQAPDECCEHSDCTADSGGACAIGPIFYCGGTQPMIANLCLYDECASSAECAPGEVCLPPRTFGEPAARCVSAECTTNADCTSRAGGECTAFFDPCNTRFVGFFCTYDDSECRIPDVCPLDPETPGIAYCAPGPMGDGDTACAIFEYPP